MTATLHHEVELTVNSCVLTKHPYLKDGRADSEHVGLDKSILLCFYRVLNLYIV